MNESTLVVVHAYAGDAHQVENALPKYLHHECPVLILSPEDAPVYIDHPQVTCRTAGKAAYTGQDTLDRQRAHLEIIAEFPQRYLLLHDSDSVCLSPSIPDYLYADPYTVWSNEVDAVNFIGRTVGHGPEFNHYSRLFPRVFQPPLFFSHDALDRMLAVSDVAMEECPPWAKLIDWYFVAMARNAKLAHRTFLDGISRPIWNVDEIARVYFMVRTYGTCMVHSVKTKEALDTLVAGFRERTEGPDWGM